MKITKSGKSYIIEPEAGDTTEQILVEAIKLFMERNDGKTITTVK